MRSARRPALVTLLTAAVVLLAVACGSSDEERVPTATATGTPSASASPEPTATATPGTTASPTPAASETPSPTATSTSPAAGRFPIEVLFSRHPESDSDPAAVFAVDRVAPDSGVARYAIGQLLEGPTAEEADAGYFSTWTSFMYGDDSDCEGERFAIALEDGVATVRFCVRVILLGVVADGQALSALTATLERFATVDRVVVLNRAGDCMFDLSGLNRCLD